MKNIRYALEGALFAAAMTMFKALPVERASALGGWLGRTIGPHLPASATALKNLAFAFPEKTAEERKRIAEGMWDNLGRIMGEYPHLLNIIMNRTEVSGEENLDAIGKDKPCIIVSAHMANWELAPFYFNHRRDWPMPGIFRAPNNPYVARTLDKCRLNKHDGLYIAKSAQGVRDMVRTLKRGERLGNLIDQKYNGGVMTPFFGHPAPTSQAFAQLAIKFDCPIVPLRVERLPKCRFRITIAPSFMPAGQSGEETVARSTKILEDWIRERPEQWLWLHRRWGKSAPTSVNDRNLA